MPQNGLSAFPIIESGDPRALLRELVGRLDSKDLTVIAAADRGDDLELHSEQLRSIARIGRVPAPLNWHPLEVLQLIRWSKPSGDDASGHRQRAFCCAALITGALDANTDPPDLASRETLLGLLLSLDALGLFLDHDAAVLLNTLIADFPEFAEQDAPFFGIGLLWLALGQTCNWPSPALADLVSWITEVEDLVAGQWRNDLGVGAAGAWLFGQRNKGLRDAEWMEFIRTLPNRVDEKRHTIEVVESVRLIAEMI